MPAAFRPVFSLMLFATLATTAATGADPEPVNADKPVAAPAEPRIQDVTEYPAEIQQVRDAMKTRLKVEKQPKTLSRVLQVISDAGQVNIVLDEGSLRDLGLTINYPVQVKVNGMTVGEAFDAITSELSLAYSIDNSVVNVTSVQRLSRQTEIRVYDVAPLLDGQTTAADVAEEATTMLYTTAQAVPQQPTRAVAMQNRVVISASPVVHARVQAKLGALTAAEIRTRVDERRRPRFVFPASGIEKADSARP